MKVDLKAFRSELIVVTIKTRSTTRKITQIMFGRDGSIYVNTPYFHHRDGLLVHAKMIPNSRPHGQQDIDLTVGGKVASHLVKYSHHPDGRVHFSQTGRVRSEIKKQSLALDKQEGHIFTVSLEGLEAFEEELRRQNPEPNPRRATITFDFVDSPEPIAFKIVGRWYDVDNLQYSGVLQSTAGPIVPVQRPDGTQQFAFVLANPLQGTRQVLLLTCEPLQTLSDKPASLIFIGGFDPKEVVNDLSRETGFLAFIYPADNVESLRETLGSIDCKRDS